MSYSAKEIQMIQYATKLQSYCEHRECDKCPFYEGEPLPKTPVLEQCGTCIIGVPQFWELEKTIGRKDV